MGVTPWSLLDSTKVPGTGEPLRLLQRGEDFSLRLGNIELMNSRAYNSEVQLATLSLAKIAGRKKPRLLIAGLGMGFTLRAALDGLPKDARIDVVELVPAVVTWNRGPLGPVSKNALDDPRVNLIQGDVAMTIYGATGAYDVIALDVDEGPEGSAAATVRLYDNEGVRAAYRALRPGGVFAVWSPGPDQRFAPRLRKAGFAVEELRVTAGANGGSKHVIWLGQRP